ncbi:unnamed protein product [Nesidiocoris tenuis]|uniref:Pep3/Vps18 beta-propeller domain-containing protein n=1 Tax=Nesidiocoris tenuis TaxID=355587 RepID=A0A6H5GQB0_9HEMI|nr:unnamed protein product [Nesidiocoris tenuis]
MFLSAIDISKHGEGLGAFVVTDDDNVYGFGLNTDEKLLGLSADDVEVPTKIDNLCCKTIFKIVVGVYQGVALSENGSVFIWNGESEPSLFDLDSPAVDIACGSDFFLILTKGSNVHLSGKISAGHSSVKNEKISLPEAVKVWNLGQRGSSVTDDVLSTITGLEYHRVDKSDTYFVIATTQDRLYQFVGRISNPEERPLLTSLFNRYLGLPEIEFAPYGRQSANDDVGTLDTRAASDAIGRSEDQSQVQHQTIFGRARRARRIPLDGLHQAKHVIEKENNIDEAMKLVESCELLKIEDVLEFFPDVTTIDHFKDAICASLQEYNQHIDDLKEEMEDATKSAQIIRNEINAFRSRYAGEEIERGFHPLGSVLEKIVLERNFYIFLQSYFFKKTFFAGTA